jgi:RHS repeat-associated protein
VQYTFRDEGKRIVTEYLGTTASQDDIFLGSLLVGSNNPPMWRFYASDHLGTPRLVTSGGGGVFENRKYWPYGEEAAGGPTPQRVRFAAMERDVESNHYYDHARSHDFNLGRFVSPDILGGRPRDPQSWNRYSYAKGNPLRYVDPNGEDLRIAVAFASDANVTRRDQIAIARGIGNAFVRAGVKNVSVFLGGNQVLGTGFDAKAHRLGKNASTSLTIFGKNADMDKTDLMGRTPLFGSKSEISLTKINGANLGVAATDAVIGNVGAHETGHGSGALSIYRFDTQKERGGEPGSIMETKVDPEDLIQPRDFSLQDQRFLQQCLNEGNCEPERFQLQLTPTPQ